jgi:preprotein translocase subunit SecA
MKDYYGILNISKNATPAEVKKAYFTLIRKFPPDRHPQEFMKIREAYEVLADESTRKQYDLVESMPDTVKWAFEQGKKALEENDPQKAIELLERITRAYPQFPVVNSLLGEAYLENGNSGKAIGIFKELAEQEEDNISFAQQLARAYLSRGWHKKALVQFRRALSLDEDNESLWIGLIESHLAANDNHAAQSAILEALEVSRRNGWDNVNLYCCAIQNDIYIQDHDNMKKHLEELTNKALEKEEEKANVATFLATLSKKIINIDLYEEAMATINAACILQPANMEFESIKKEVKTYYSILMLERDPVFDDFLAEMLDFELQYREAQVLPEYQVIQFTNEIRIINEIQSFRKEIMQLKKSYPELYAIKKEFFDNIINPRREEYLYNTYDKKYKKFQKLYPEVFEPEEEDDDDYYEDYCFQPEPYRRPEPKIGRNEPCPCGSGKKYKKCCGK